MTGARQLRSTWVSDRRSSETPRARAASTYSVCFTASTVARTMRP